MNFEFDVELLAQVDRVFVAPHRDGEGVTVTVDVQDEHLQIVTKLEKLPTEMRRKGTYLFRGGVWVRTTRVDGNEAEYLLSKLFGAKA